MKIEMWEEGRIDMGRVGKRRCGKSGGEEKCRREDVGRVGEGRCGKSEGGEMWEDWGKGGKCRREGSFQPGGGVGVGVGGGAMHSSLSIP